MVFILLIASTLSFEPTRNNCESEYEVFPEARVTIIYKQTPECSQYQLLKMDEEEK